jgi:bacterioferritin-associated ferredoxin
VGFVGGVERDRTVDLLNAIQALSQLSYGPTFREGRSSNATRRPKFRGRIVPALRYVSLRRMDPIHPAIRGLKTVCRCNNIKYRTIERAILAGAQSIDDVAASTTATTGHCGGSCTADVLGMLEEHAEG